ncbi:MAG: tetratricopeptide repeat protein [Spirochaetaceae bacterium]|nr:tetratricopeptide repeat protein [Spirochaetaceae bacterium]
MGRKILFASISVVIFFGVLELILWLTGIPTLLDRKDPFRGFSGMISVFTQEGDVYRTRRASLDTFNDQSFLAEKPPHGIRIFCLGESSSYGFPWGGEVAFTSILGEALAVTHPRLHIEAINASGVSYAIYRLNIVADELLRYKPDIFIIYSGNNEFVESGFFDDLRRQNAVTTRLEYILAQSRTYSGMQWVWERLNKGPASTARVPIDVVRDGSRIFSPAEKKLIVEEYRRQLERLVSRAQDSGVKVILCTVPCNLRQWRPEASTLGSALSASDTKEWSSTLATGARQLDAKNFRAAILNLDQASKLASAHAQTQFLLAQAYEGEGRWNDAQRAYSRACDNDAAPCRRLSAINEVIRELAGRRNLILLDIDRFFVEQSEHGLLGFNLIEDYVHPTRKGHELIAWQLWEAIEQAGAMGEKVTPSKAVFDEILAKRRPLLQTTNNAVWLYNQGVVLQNQGNAAAAIEKYRASLAIAPNYAGALLNLSKALLDTGQYHEAASAAERLIKIDPRDPMGHNNLGFALAKTGRADEAIAHCQEAVRLNPTIAKCRINLGFSFMCSGQYKEAVQPYLEALKMIPDDPDTHNDLGFALEKTGHIEQATLHYREALRLRPDHPLAGDNLKRILQNPVR